MPTALLVFLAFERLLGDPERPRGIQAGLFGSLAGLIRADGSVWIIMLLGCAALLWAFRGKSRELGVARSAAPKAGCVSEQILKTGRQAHPSRFASSDDGRKAGKPKVCEGPDASRRQR